MVRIGGLLFWIIRFGGISIRQGFEPDSQELRFFTRRRSLRLSAERLDVVDGEHGGGDEPGEAERGADDDQDGHHEEVEVVAATFLESGNSPVT